MDSTVENNKMGKAIATVVAVVGSLTTAMWAVITYVFPDPSILGIGALNWKNFVIFFGTFIFFMAFLVSLEVRNFPIPIRGTVNFLLAAGLSACFFFLGMEYAKPSFQFAREQQKFVENESTTLLGKRIEMVDNVRVELLGCRMLAQSPTCTLELTSTNKDREIGFNPGTSLFEPSGGTLAIERLVVGSNPSKRLYGIPLVRGLKTRITLIFEPTRENLQRIPSMKLVMRGFESNGQVIKFNEITSSPNLNPY